MGPNSLDLGHQHTLKYTCWRPDRTLNPQYAAVPDLEKAGAILTHQTPAGEPCRGAITFDHPTARAFFKEVSLWRVTSWEPLTLEPSILCKRCGDHGFVRKGKWVPA